MEESWNKMHIKHSRPKRNVEEPGNNHEHTRTAKGLKTSSILISGQQTTMPLPPPPEFEQKPITQLIPPKQSEVEALNQKIAALTEELELVKAKQGNYHSSFY